EEGPEWPRAPVENVEIEAASRCEERRIAFHDRVEIDILGVEHVIDDDNVVLPRGLEAHHVPNLEAGWSDKPLLDQTCMERAKTGIDVNAVDVGASGRQVELHGEGARGEIEHSLAIEVMGKGRAHDVEAARIDEEADFPVVTI